jgi:hypothetical protein
MSPVTSPSLLPLPPSPPPPPPPYPPPPPTDFILYRKSFEDPPYYISDSEIVELCKATPPFAGCKYGNKLIKISEHLAVKLGIGLEIQEAENQNYVRRHVDSAILYVPRVFRFFEAFFSGSHYGLIVMEFIRGTTLDSLSVLENPDLAKRTRNAIEHLATIPIPIGQGPGPVGGGPAQGYLWSDEGTDCTFFTIADMENWMNTRLSVVKVPNISLAQLPLRMRHMDLVRRNICLLPDSSICFLDWAFAGFYPDIFEIYTFRDLKYRDEVWFKQLLDLFPEPKSEDEQIIRYLGVPAFVNIKYSYVPTGPQIRIARRLTCRISFKHNSHSCPTNATPVVPPPTLPPPPSNIGK